VFIDERQEVSERKKMPQQLLAVTAFL